jgi:hypothetical protein
MIMLRILNVEWTSNLEINKKINCHFENRFGADITLFEKLTKLIMHKLENFCKLIITGHLIICTYIFVRIEESRITCRLGCTKSKKKARLTKGTVCS